MSAKESEYEVKIRLAEDIARIGYWEWNYENRKVNFSDELYRIFEIKRDSLSDDYRTIIKEKVHKDYRKVVLEAAEKAEKCGTFEEIEFKIVKSNGEQRWLRTKGNIIYSEDGGLYKLIGAIQDITEWKYTETTLRGKLDFINILINAIPNPVFFKDDCGIYRYCNNAFVDFLGLEKEQIIGCTVYDINPSKLAKVYHKADMDLMKKKGTQTYESQVKYKDGSLRDVIFCKAVITDEKDAVIGLVGVINDITDHIKMEKRIVRLLKLKDAILEVNHAIIGVGDIIELFELILDKVLQSMDNSSMGSILILDNDKKLRVAACRGYACEKLMDYNISLRDTFIWEKTYGKLDKAIMINDISNSRLKHLEEIKVQSMLSAPIYIDGKLYGLIDIYSNYQDAYDEIDLEIMEYMRNQFTIVVGKHRLIEETIYISRHDNLTKAYNRGYFKELFKLSLEKAKLNSETFSLVIFDINELKLINDIIGHLAGDILLKTFAAQLRKRVRSSDVIARLGGDEFIGLFYNTNSKRLINRFEKLNDYFLRHPIVFEDKSIICSFSYGIANFNIDGNTYDALVKIADERMYEYKNKLKKTKKMLERNVIMNKFE